MKAEKGNIKTELILGIFLLSFFAVFFTFIAIFKISERRQIEVETFNLQKIFYELQKSQIDNLANFNLFLPSGTYYGLYNPTDKTVIKGRDVLPKEKIKLGAQDIFVEKAFLYPSLTLYQTVYFGATPYILAIKREFDAERYMIKSDILIFLPFAIISFVTLTGFAYFFYKRRLLNPFETLKSAYLDVRETKLSNRLKPVGISEWDMLYEQFNQMLESIESYKGHLEKTIIELSSANDALKSAQKEIVFSEKMATVGRLAAGLAHEIGNPLTSIMGYLSFMIENTTNEEDKKMLTLILNETDRINRIIKDLLNFARSHSDDMLETCNPRDVINDTLTLLLPQKDFKQIKLVNNFTASTPVYFSAEELKQVILNLLINAMDVSKEGGTVTISSYFDDDSLVIAVSDEGGGVPDEIKDKIFEPFFTTKPVGKGTGLGLSVVHTLVNKYNGKVGFENTEKGATFRVFLKRLEV